MCNFLHENHEKIPVEGIGWKLFHCYEVEDGEFEYYTVFGAVQYNRIRPTYRMVNPAKEFIEWHGHSDGFCFMIEEKEAYRLLKDLQSRNEYSYVVVRKIEYEGGLGCHWETGIIREKAYLTGICTKFRIIEESEDGDDV